MITLRPSSERGHASHGWLDTYHTFSFNTYYDPGHMGFSSLRVINEDRVAGSQGFGTHPHRDMEIITYVLEGALEHKDSLGTGSVIRPGEVQIMSAGTGIRHSEFNHSKAVPVHLLQIWILPEKKGLPPRYDQQAFTLEPGKLKLLAAPPGRDGVVIIYQDAELYAAKLTAGQKVTHQLRAGRKAWLQVARGGVALNSQSLSAGDGAAVTEEEKLEISAKEPAEVLLFDLA